MSCQGLYDAPEESPHWSVGPGGPAPGKAVLLRKDPIMLLNEHCQRNQLKVTGTPVHFATEFTRHSCYNLSLPDLFLDPSEDYPSEVPPFP